MSDQNTDRFNLMLPPGLKSDAGKAATRAGESLAAFIRIAMRCELRRRRGKTGTMKTATLAPRRDAGFIT